MAKELEVLQGTLDLLILKAVSLDPLHGYGILARIQQLSDEQLLIQQGSLYPALYKLEASGALAAAWGESDNKLRAKYYTLTELRKTRLLAETERWGRLSKVMRGILGATRAAALSPAQGFAE